MGLKGLLFFIFLSPAIAFCGPSFDSSKIAIWGRFLNGDSYAYQSGHLFLKTNESSEPPVLWHKNIRSFTRRFFITEDYSLHVFSEDAAGSSVLRLPPTDLIAGSEYAEYRAVTEDGLLRFTVGERGYAAFIRLDDMQQIVRASYLVDSKEKAISTVSNVRGRLALVDIRQENFPAYHSSGRQTLENFKVGSVYSVNADGSFRLVKSDGDPLKVWVTSAGNLMLTAGYPSILFGLDSTNNRAVEVIALPRDRRPSLNARALTEDQMWAQNESQESSLIADDTDWDSPVPMTPGPAKILKLAGSLVMTSGGTGWIVRSRGSYRFEALNNVSNILDIHYVAGTHFILVGRRQGEGLTPDHVLAFDTENSAGTRIAVTVLGSSLSGLIHGGNCRTNLQSLNPRRVATIASAISSSSR